MLPTTATTYKRARTPSLAENNSETCTDTIYRMFREQYQLTISLQKFTGLCAYLFAILRLGFRINTSDMDRFIWQYMEFQEQHEMLVRRQIEQNTPRLPSYHHWFTTHVLCPHTGTKILTAFKLWDIQREHPHLFLHAELSLEYISRQRLYRTT